MQYLVMLVNTQDDVPIAMCNTRDEAVALAHHIDGMPTEPICNLFQVDCSTPVCVKVVSFDARGIPTQVDVVRSFM